MAIAGISTTGSGRGKRRVLLIYAIIILLVVVVILSGCRTGRTGTLVEPNHEEISRIRKVGLCVEVERGFAVRLQYVSNADELEVSLQNLIGSGLVVAVQKSRGVPGEAMVAGAIGGVVGGVIGDMILEPSPDVRNTKALRPEAVQINSADAIAYALADKLQTAKIFPAVEMVQSQFLATVHESGIDTLFIFTVRRWGLRPPPGSKYEKGDKAKAQLELDVNLKLVSSTKDKILWERNDFYLDGKTFSIGDFKSQKGLLISRMDYALQMVCDLTAKEIYRTPQN